VPARSLVLTGPVPLTGGPLIASVAALVAADVLARRSRAEGGTLAWSTATVAGGLTGQWEAEEELSRAGLDKATVGREAFAERLATMVEERRRQLGRLAAGLRLDLDVEAAEAAAEAAGRAARTAFVRLFDAGLVVEADRIVATCPRCATAVPAADLVEGEVEGDAVTLRLVLVDGSDGDGDGYLDVICAAPELLPGAVAVAVPNGSPSVGRSAVVPVAATVVPVVADPGVRQPTFVVPAHDPCALAIARRIGLVPAVVIDRGGAVCVPGPLAGLARYAARAAAHRLLEAERAVVGSVAQTERVDRCPACSTVVVPLLGRHWFLAVADLETAASDAVRDGRLAVWPPAARDELLSRAGRAREWCLSQQVWGGVPLPVGRCLDCGHVDVSVHPNTSCGRCMGDLVAVDEMLDARFVRVVWPLAGTGWPEGGERQRAGDGDGPSLLVAPADATGDVLAMVGLGLRLGGTVPFDEVSVLAPIAWSGDPDGHGAAEIALLIASEGARTVRVALARGGLDTADASDLVARMDNPPAGPVDVDRLSEAMATAFAAASPAAALVLLTAAVREGVPARDADRVRALAGPFVGA